MKVLSTSSTPFAGEQMGREDEMNIWMGAKNWQIHKPIRRK